MSPLPLPAHLVRSLRILLMVVLAVVAVGCDDTYVEGPAAGTAVQTEDADGAEGQSVLTSEAPVQLEAPVSNLGTQEAVENSIEVAATESLAFDPTFIEAQPGAALAVQLSNSDNVQHTFTIDEADIDVLLDEQGEELVDVVVPESGHLRFYCRFHEAEGMAGAIFTDEA